MKTGTFRQQPYEDAVGGAAQANLNLVNAPIKDTYPLSPNYWAILRFRANNPGMWNFHCHYFFHNLLGLQMVFNVAADRQMRPPDEWFKPFNMDSTLCEPNDVTHYSPAGDDREFGDDGFHAAPSQAAR